MKLVNTLMAAGFAAAVMMAPTAFAAEPTTPSTDTVQMSKLLENLHAAGYNVILKVELDNGQYRANVIDLQGKPLRIEIAPTTGEILKPKAEGTVLSLFDAAKKAEEAGYHNIYKITATQGKVEIKAFNKDNKKVTFDINTKTGQISKETF